MRRWSGRVGGANIVLTLQCYDDSNHRLSRTLASASDTVCESIAVIVLNSSIAETDRFFWMTDNDGINNLNAAITGANAPASYYYIRNRLHTESLFTYLSTGQGIAQRDGR